MSAQARITALQAPPEGGGKIAAIGPTDREATFVALVPGVGFRYLDLSGEPPASWATAGGFGGEASGAFGLHYRHGSGASAFVSFVEAPPRSWACLRLPAAGEPMSVDEAALVERTSLAADAVAACGPNEGGEEAVLVLASGAVRFMDLSTGKSVGKALKLEAVAPGCRVSACGLGGRKFAVVRQDGSFSIAELDAAERKAALVSQGVLAGGAVPSPCGQPFAAAAAGAAADAAALVLCWGEAPRTFAAASLGGDAPTAAALPARAGAAAAATALWFCVAGYLVECAPAAGGGALALAVRDARFGMPVAAESLPLTGGKAGGHWLACTAGSTTLILGGRGAELAAVRWALPPFGLHLVVGAGAAAAAAAPGAAGGALGPLHEALAGKRTLDDPSVEELFSAKRRKSTDEALASEVRCRACPPTEGLADLVARQRCWAAARALLGLPELPEDAAVRLLAADRALDAGLLAAAVRRPSTPKLLEAALGDHLPPALLPGVLEVLLEVIEAHQEFPPDDLEAAAPGLPTQAEAVRFLSALADGCLPSLIRLEADLLGRVADALNILTKEQSRTERSHAALRVAARLGLDAAGGGAREAPAVEAVLVDF